MNPTPETVARMFGVPIERVREQYRRNARQLAAMAAEADGKKVNGYTRAELIQRSRTFFDKANN